MHIGSGNIQSFLPGYLVVGHAVMLVGLLAFENGIVGCWIYAPGKAVPRVTLQDGYRLYYRCNGLLSLLFLVCLLGVGANMDLLSPTVISERGFELLSTTFIFSVSWSIARHCNYLGDLLLAQSFSLPCGISAPVPYFYPLYLLILPIWRERSGEARCAEKYKEVWAEYSRLVPWRILP
ncbi:hypothetical protein GH714_038538 [Hevea brasiliensis]|uniref:Steroid 5-alpha reductase C-terminal domain-containing protein n=1 Tax=Hevea brasiliensis TaxID=3981 RepID=A0A6A6KNB9_HEVBR|nr:hypothetical protein GH714_038538 [Hevea brasiliensis]